MAEEEGETDRDGGKNERGNSDIGRHREKESKTGKRDRGRWRERRRRKKRGKRDWERKT